MPKYFLTSFLFLLVFFSLSAPLPSHAKFVETGPPCTPEVIPDFGDIPTPSVVTCPWCPAKLGSTKIRLSWDLDEKEFIDPVCGITCSRTSGTCLGALSKDSEGIGTTTINTASGWNLKPKDEIYLVHEVRKGNNYRIGCSERYSNTVGISSAEVKVEDDCRVPCEVPFETIVSRLSGGQKTVITEENFNGWTYHGSEDNANAGQGSGDMEDIIGVMDTYQSCLRLPNSADPDYYYSQSINYDRNIEKIRESIDNYDPITVAIINENQGVGHALLALDLRQNGDNVLIDVVDSNSQGVIQTLTCSKRRIFLVDVGYQDAMYCRYPSRLTEYLTWVPLTLDAQRMDCGSEKRVRSEPTTWLKSFSNRPAFGNQIPNDDSIGICFGYNQFVRDIACFGDFVGTDYHPDDGKYVGEHCDENHYPIQKKSGFLNNSSAWLANLLQPLKNLKLK